MRCTGRAEDSGGYQVQGRAEKDTHDCNSSACGQGCGVLDVMTNCGSGFRELRIEQDWKPLQLMDLWSGVTLQTGFGERERIDQALVNGCS